MEQGTGLRDHADDMCLAGAALTFLLYHDAIATFEKANDIVRGALGGPGDSTATYSIFATFPAPYFTGNLGPLIRRTWPRWSWGS